MELEPYIRAAYDEEQVKVCFVCHCLAFKVNPPPPPPPPPPLVTGKLAG